MMGWSNNRVTLTELKSGFCALLIEMLSRQAMNKKKDLVSKRDLASMGFLVTLLLLS